MKLLLQLFEEQQIFQNKKSWLKTISVSSSCSGRVKGTHVAHPGSEWQVIVIA